jgi:hypothetical protein
MMIHPSLAAADPRRTDLDPLRINLRAGRMLDGRMLDVQRSESEAAIRTRPKCGGRRPD